jgi:hypothetical protein
LRLLVVVLLLLPRLVVGIVLPNLCLRFVFFLRREDEISRPNGIVPTFSLTHGGGGGGGGGQWPA